MSIKGKYKVPIHLSWEEKNTGNYRTEQLDLSDLRAELNRISKTKRRRDAELVIAEEIGIRRRDIPSLRGEDWFDGLVEREMRLNAIAEMIRELFPHIDGATTMGRMYIQANGRLP